MTYPWMNKKEEFETLDARQANPGSFFPLVSSTAEILPEGSGLHIIQSFEPVPLYGVLGSMGFEHETVLVSANEFHVYFYKTPTTTKVKAKPFVLPDKKPAAVGAIGLEEGYLTPEQINLVLQHIPLDIAFTDEYGEVAYANHGKQAQLDNEAASTPFNAGMETEDEGWGEQNGRLLHQQTIVIRDDDGHDKGILAVTQDITDICALEGEQRILDWE
ncbi:MAG: hypothetical protein CSA11_00285 [Chloroflexi bacterium]|nr:MAG: hypothetical protein CSB13_11485 [Chloroflexota bacterium]PIE82534.1 MAG: hypothetical protein CSA11_00285 [Chloroflexota bacterium]